MCCFLTQIEAQDIVPNSDRGFYVKDGIVTSSIAIERTNLVQRSKIVIIPQQVLHQAAVFTPDDIDAYGFLDGQIYVSAEIQINGINKSVFLEEVINADSVIVYYYPFESQDYFFVLKAGSPVLEKVTDIKAFWNLLVDENSCSQIKDKISKKLTRRKIKHYYQAYKNCNTNLFQKIHYGLTFESGFMRLDYNNKNPNTGLIHKGSEWTALNSFVAVGAFLQIPLDEYFNFRPELLYSTIFHNQYFQKMWRNTINRIELNADFRYNLNNFKGNKIPYIDVGLLGDYKLQRLNKNNSPLEFGFIAGVGLEFRTKKQYMIDLGLRFRFVSGGGDFETIEGVYDDLTENLKFLSLYFSFGL